MLDQKVTQKFPTTGLHALKNPRHEAFAQALACGMSATAAYVEAGYKASTTDALG
jgi:hypothetical protein